MGGVEQKLDKVERLLGLWDVYGTPAASLTWGVDGAEERFVLSGMKGEKMTARALDDFVAGHEGVKVFHSVRWPGSKGDTDHVVLAGSTIIIIDSKRWKKKRTYSVTATGNIMRGTVRFDAGKIKMIPALAAWREVLPNECSVIGLVCVAQESVWVTYNDNWKKAPFKLVTVAELPNLLDRIVSSAVAKPVDRTARLVAAYYLLNNLIEPKPEPPKPTLDLRLRR